MTTVYRGQPLVSIGIPAYNRPENLKATLNCIRKQIYTNIEIIVSDDCSPNENVGVVVREAIASGQQIKFYSQLKNIGATRNFEFVLNQATGKYFFWAEDEDLFEPEFVAKLVECMESQPDLVACTCDMKTIDFNDKFLEIHELKTIRPSANWDEVRKHFFCYPTSNIFFCVLGMFKTDCLRKANINYLAGWNGYETNGEVPFLAQISTFGRMAAIPEVLKTYRLNPNSIYHTEISLMSDFDLFMLRLVIRYRLCNIALTSKLPGITKAILIKTVVVTCVKDKVDNYRYSFGKIKKKILSSFFDK